MPRKFTKKEKDLILKQSQEFWDAAELVQQQVFDDINDHERMAMVMLPEELANVYDAYPDRSSLVPPDIYNNINSLRAKFRAIFKKKPYFKLSHHGNPGLRDDTIKKAEILLQSIEDKEADGKGFPTEADKAIYQTLIAGITTVFTRWTQKFERVARRDEESLQLELDKFGSPIYDMIAIDSYPETISLDFRRTRIDPSAAERKDIRIVGYHSISQLSELISLKNNPNSFYDFDEKELRESSFQSTEYFQYVKAETDRYPLKGLVNQQFGGKIIERQSIRGLYQLPGKNGAMEFLDLIVEIGNRTVMLGVKQNDLPIPGWELFDFPAIDEKHGRMYTPGVVEPGKDQFIEQFIKSNQSLDAANRNVYRTYVGDASACQNLPDYIENSNDQLIKIDVSGAGLNNWQEAFGALPSSELGQDSFAHAEAISRKLQQTMFLSDYTQNSTPLGAPESATGVVELVRSGDNLTDQLMEKLNDTYFRPVAIKKLILWNFFNAEKEHTIFSQDGTQFNVAPGELLLPYQMSLETSTSTTTSSMARRFVEVFPVIKDDPMYDSIVVRETLNELLDLPNKQTLLVNEEFEQMIVERENMAIKAIALLQANGQAEGATVPVHPLDKHRRHLEGHIGTEDNSPIMQQHIQAHQQAIEQQNQALGNTKDMGGNAGNEANPEAASRNPRGSGATGNFTPSESRR